MSKTTLKTGDRVAFSARHLRNTGQGHDAASRRGTLLSDPDAIGYAYVRWDNEAEMLASGVGQFGDPEYCEHVRRHGSYHPASILARVSSLAFSEA